MTDADTRRAVREPSVVDAVVPLVALVVLIGGSLALFGLDALDGPIQVALVLCAMIAALVLLKNGHRWEDIQAAGRRAVSSVTSAVFILLAVGALIGTWNLSGTIPTLVYYGIQVLSPTWYYAASALICGVIAMSIGSSWTTAGASVYSRYARKRSDVGRATVLGFLSVLALFASVTLLSYGSLPKSELEQLRQPSMMGVLESVVGPWGSVFIGLGLIVSVLGAYLAWTLMAAEVLFVAAKDDDMPRFLRRENTHGVPVAALVMTTILITAVLAVTLFSDDAFTFTLTLCSSLSLIPYLLAAAYALQIGVRGETYDTAPEHRRKELTFAAVAVVYTAFLIVAAGLEFLLLSFIIYAPGTILFVMARREQHRRVFSPAELVLFGVAVVLAVLGIAGLATGLITI